MNITLEQPTTGKTAGKMAVLSHHSRSALTKNHAQSPLIPTTSRSINFGAALMVGMGKKKAHSESATSLDEATPRRVMWTAEQVSEYLGVPIGTLRNWRSTGVGPLYLKISGHVIRYLPEDVDAWLISRRTKRASGE